MRRAAKLIADMTEGKQRFASGPHISVDDDCHTHIYMRLNSDSEEGIHHVTFSAFIRQMGVYMNAGQMQKVADELQRTACLLLALETEPFSLTSEEYVTWAQEICETPDETQNNAQTMG